MSSLSVPAYLEAVFSQRLSFRGASHRAHEHYRAGQDEGHARRIIQRSAERKQFLRNYSDSVTVIPEAFRQRDAGVKLPSRKINIVPWHRRRR